MTRLTKRTKKINEIIGTVENVSLKDSIDLLKKCPAVKFDQTIEFSLRLGVDPRKSDQQVRGTVSLPHGSGKKIILLVLAKGDKIQLALDAGADFAGNEEYLEKIKSGWTDFNAIIATPDMMRDVGKLGKILGPRGLMPSPKAGTVTPDVVKAIKEVKAGKIEFKVDKSGVINNIVGKLSFADENIIDNVITLFKAINKAKPATAKGIYIKSAAISSTMGPGIKLDVQSLTL
jgi:large subunit ribosomal protein L1